MQSVNYNSPNGMYPLSTTDNNSPAFGSGTVPGSFMAGMMLPERMQDYRTARDLSNQSSLLQNQHLAATNEDYNLASPSRLSGYDLTTGQNRSTLGLLPEQTKLAHIGLEGQLEQAPIKNKADYQKALNSLSTENRREFGAKAEHAGTIAQMFKDEHGKWIGGDAALPGIAAEISKMVGENIDPSHLNGLSQILPDIRKYNAEMNKQAAMDVAHMERTKEQTAAERYRALMMTQRPMAANIKDQRMEAYRGRLSELQDEYYRNGNQWPSTAEQAEYNSLNTILHTPESAGSANLQTQSQSGPAALNILTGKPSGASVGPPPANVSKPKQEQQETQKYQGHTYRLKKGKENDRFNQDNWEKID